MDLPQYALLEIDEGLILHENKLDFKQFYNLGTELGQGTYGVVKISKRNCEATNQLQIMSMFGVDEPDKINNEKQLSYAIKQILIPEIDTHYADQEDELIEL